VVKVAAKEQSPVRWQGTGEGGIAESIPRPSSAEGRRVETAAAVDLLILERRLTIPSKLDTGSWVRRMPDSWLGAWEGGGRGKPLPVARRLESAAVVG
jgi:hypothetical protein